MVTALKDRLARQASGEAPSPLKTAFADEPRLVFVPVNCLEADPDQPRKNLGDVTELAASIGEHGLLHPLVVEGIALGRFRIVAGERRFAACRQLGWETIPCLVRTVAEHARLALQLIENIHRQDLLPLEEARAFQRLMDEFNLSQRELAQRLGKSVAAINQTLRLLDLQQDVVADVQTSEQVNKSVLLEIAKEPDASAQRAMWEQAKTGQMTVRQARTRKKGRSTLTKKAALYTIALAEAKVVVHFKKGEATPERVKAALEQALAVVQSGPATSSDV